MTKPETGCPACLASRRSTVDAFFLGFRSGFRQSVIAAIENKGEIADVDLPVFCLAHDKMMTEAYAAEIRTCMRLSG